VGAHPVDQLRGLDLLERIGVPVNLETKGARPQRLEPVPVPGVRSGLEAVTAGEAVIGVVRQPEPQPIARDNRARRRGEQGADDQRKQDDSPNDQATSG
jgi:hypothetical protein